MQGRLWVYDFWIGKMILFIVAGQVVEGDACNLIYFLMLGVDFQLLSDCFFCFLEILKGLSELI